MKNDETNKHLKSISNNLKFFFYLTLAGLFGIAALIGLELG